MRTKKLICRALATVISLTLLSATGFSQNQNPGPAQSQDYNPVYHYYPSGDPVGLFYFGGQYFLNWGSASSSDLVHWKITEYGRARNNRNTQSTTPATPNATPGAAPAAAPNPTPNVLMSMSGSVVVDWNNTTGLGKNGNPPIIALNMSSGRAMNFAYSNDTAKTWIQSDKTVVIPNSNSGSWRDPKVFWYEPEQKWIMVMPWCEIHEVRFFSSKNLTDWVYMSKFGPWPSDNGQWECVDFFPLAVDNNPSKIKWVMVISLQPRNGEYYIGDFDGKRFTMDKDFVDALSYETYVPSGIMLFDFERGLDEWKMEGDAFLACPNEKINGAVGLHCLRSGQGTGKLTSPEFLISKNYIDFLVGGGYFPGKECINLLVDGKVVRTETGNAGNAHVSWAGWDVTDLKGKLARIEIVDNMTESSMNVKGYITCDAIMLSDELPKPPYREYNYGWEKAFWADWGWDYYAVRAWNNYAPGETRTIWAGWMGNWRYNDQPVRGNYSVSRSLELKTFPEGIRLIQNPIKELESLRTIHKTAEATTFEGVLRPKKITPSKNTYELIVEFENVSAEEFGLNLCVGPGQKTVVAYNAVDEELFVDRNNSGYDDFSAVFPCISTGPLKNRTNTVKLHIFVDKCSIEVFGNNGETVISSKIYPDTTSVGIELFSNNGTVKVKSFDLWELASINLY